MPTVLFTKTKYRNLAPVFDQKSALEGIFLVDVQAKDGLPFADQANASVKKSLKNHGITLIFSPRLTKKS
jgi:hypothetical protein